MGSLGGAVKAGFNLKKNIKKRSGHLRNDVPRVEFIMTVGGLLIHPIEVEVSGFSFGPATALGLNSVAPTFSLVSRDFMIRKVSDECSLFMQQASMTRKAMQVSITVVEQLTADRLKHITYAFSNAFIKSFQLSGTTTEGIVETVQFDSDRVEVGSSPAILLLHEMVHGLSGEPQRRS